MGKPASQYPLAALRLTAFNINTRDPAASNGWVLSTDVFARMI